MQQKVVNRAIIISGICAKWSVREIIEFHKINRITVFSAKNKFDKFVAAGGRSDEFDLPGKAHQRRSYAKGLVLADEVRNIVEATRQVHSVHCHQAGDWREHSVADNAGRPPLQVLRHAEFPD
jgi:hypothetical protein